MISRFRLAGLSVMVGVALVGAVFYGVVNSHYLGAILVRTLGPYSDHLAEHGASTGDPGVWQRMAARHDVAIEFQPVDGPVQIWDDDGQATTEIPEGTIMAPRQLPDGSRITFHWKLWSFGGTHLPFLAGLAVMVVLVVGSAFWFLQAQLKPLSWLRGGVDAVAAGDFTTRVPVVRDDEIGQVAEAFNDMAQRVGEMMDDRERLLADVSHELRSPIARMKVALEFMPEGDKREALAHDLREMENLIRVLLEREQLRSRIDRPEYEAIDLSAIAADVAAHVTAAPGVRFSPDGPVTLEADPTLMRMLLQNLVENAVKFSRADSAPVEIDLQASADRVTLRVRDEGVGIPAESSEKLFEPFVKLDPSRGHRVGYGIGLNICQRIVHLHDGSIRLIPRDPLGTDAVVELHVARRRGTPA